MIESVSAGSDNPLAAPSAVAVHRTMLTIREAELRVLALSTQGHAAGSIHPCIGQEIVPAVVARHLTSKDRTVATYRGHGWAIASGVPLRDFFAEILGRETGTNGGRAGSAYMSAPQYGFMGENSIVAAGLPISNGIAMGLEHAGHGGVVAVSFGDGATNQGACHEAIVFAIARKLPVVFICENNSWSEMTPIETTVPGTTLHTRAGGYGLPAVAVDGCDVDELDRAMAEAFERARNGAGPSFLEVSVPRLTGHYNKDIEHYRSTEDKEAHADRDPLEHLEQRLIAAGTLTADGIAEIRRDVAETIDDAVRVALADHEPNPDSATAHVTSTSGHVVSPALPAQGRTLAYGLAANLALEMALETRPEVVLFGEDIAVAGGVFGVTRNLHKKYGERVFDTPISEAAILGAAVGAAMSGMRPVVEVMWSDFLMVAFDQLVNQAANVRYLSRGAQTAPMVVRMQQGVTPGSCAQHSQSLEALIAHIPGLKVGIPSVPDDAFAMLRAAIADPDPVVIIESRAIYQDKGLVDVDAPVQDVGGARLLSQGSDALIVTWGRMTRTAREAANTLEREGISVSVLDLRWLVPLDESLLMQAVREVAGKVLVLHEANLTGGFGAEISARIGESLGDALDLRVHRLGLPDTRVPASPRLQERLVPSVESVSAAVRRLVSPA